MSGNRETVLLTLAAEGADTISTRAAADILGIPSDALDESFGVVAIDPDQHLFAVRVFADAIDFDASPPTGGEGPYSDPRIEPFGLPEP